MKKLYSALLAGCLIVPCSVAVSAQQELPNLQKTVDDKAQELKYLESEIAFTTKRKLASQKKLKGYEADLDKKQSELSAAQQRYAANSTVENEQFLRNAEKRVELAELSIKSRVASVVRLETKESELAAKLESLRGEVAELSDSLRQERLAAKVEQKTQSIKSEMELTTSRLQSRMETLQRENERLRRVALSETEKREAAELRAKAAEERAELAEQTLARFQASGAAAPAELAENLGNADSALSARANALAEMERVRNILATDTTGGSGVNLTLQGDDGTQYGLFQYLGAQQYRTDAVIHSNIARFRVGGRTYQVKIADNNVGQEFVFLYDMRNAEQPRFVTFKKSLLAEDGAIARE